MNAPDPKAGPPRQERAALRQEGRLRPFFMACAFASGASALVYEVVWVKLFTLFLGHTVYAASAVLSGYMAGLALGSYAVGRSLDGRRYLPRLYAGMQMAIGLLALAVPSAIDPLTALHVWTSRQFSPSPAVGALVKFGLSFLALLAPTTLIGATFPLLAKLVTGARDEVGRAVGRLYAANTLGAAAGGLLAGFVLVPSLGLMGSLPLGTGIDLLVGTFVLLWAGRHASNCSATEGAVGSAGRRPEPGAGTPPGADRGRERAVLCALALSGFAALAYEVLWTRALLFFLGNSVYAFSTVVVTFLFGLAVGGRLFAGVASGAGRDPLLWLGFVESLIGLSAAASAPLLADGLHRAAEIWPVLAAGWDWHAPLATRFLLAFLALFPAAVFMGGTLPLAAQLYAADPGLLGSRLGRLYAANTLGAVVGGVTAGFALLPWVGVLKGVAALAVLNALIGVGLLRAAAGPAARRVVVAGVIAVLASAGLLTTSTGLRLRRGDEALDRVLYYTEGATATVKVGEAEAGQRVLSIDGFPVAGTLKVWRPIQKLLGHLPMLLHPDPRRVLIIGLGAGGTAWAMRQYDPDVLDCVELSPEVVEAARFFPEVNHGILEDPRLHLILDDGRNHLRISDERYDVISIDATSPKAAGNGSLYTQEFYQFTRRRLADGGILVQWLPYHLLSGWELRVILNTFRAAYSDVTLWYSPDLRYLIALGATRPLAIDLVRLQERLGRSGVRQDLGEVGLADPYALLRLFALDAGGVRRFVGDGVPLNTDMHPVIEFYRRSPDDFGLFPFRGREGFPPVRWLGLKRAEAARAAAALERHLRAFDHVILARYYEERDPPRARRELRRAIAMSGEGHLVELLAE